MNKVYGVFDERCLIDLYSSEDRAKEELLKYARSVYYKEDYYRDEKVKFKILDNGSQIYIIDEGKRESNILEDFYMYELTIKE